MESSAILTGRSEAKDTGWLEHCRANDMFIRGFDASRSPTATTDLFPFSENATGICTPIRSCLTEAAPPITKETNNGVCSVILFKNFEEEARAVA